MVSNTSITCWRTQVLDYLKSPRGALGKTAGCFSLLAKDAKTKLQPSIPDQVHIEIKNKRKAFTVFEHDHGYPSDVFFAHE